MNFESSPMRSYSRCSTVRKRVLNEGTRQLQEITPLARVVSHYKSHEYHVFTLLRAAIPYALFNNDNTMQYTKYDLKKLSSSLRSNEKWQKPSQQTFSCFFYVY